MYIFAFQSQLFDGLDDGEQKSVFSYNDSFMCGYLVSCGSANNAVFLTSLNPLFVRFPVAAV